MAKVSYRGTPPWRFMKTLSNDLGNVAKEALEMEWPKALLHDGPIKHFLISCTVCNHNIQASNISLWQRGKWASVFCPTCCNSKTARVWKCPCTVQWPACTFHAPMGYMCKRNAGTKRAAHRRAIEPLAKRRTRELPVSLPTHDVLRQPRGRTLGTSIYNTHIANAREHTL